MLPHLNIYVGYSKRINSQISPRAEEVTQRFCSEPPPARGPVGIDTEVRGEGPAVG